MNFQKLIDEAKKVVITDDDVTKLQKKLEQFETLNETREIDSEWLNRTYNI